MIIVPKSNKRFNKRKIDESFYELLDTINRMNKKQAENSPSGKITKPRVPQMKGASLNVAKRKWVEFPGCRYFA